MPVQVPLKLDHAGQFSCHQTFITRKQTCHGKPWFWKQFLKNWKRVTLQFQTVPAGTTVFPTSPAQRQPFLVTTGFHLSVLDGSTTLCLKTIVLAFVKRGFSTFPSDLPL
jgi:hypothetical protein